MSKITIVTGVMGAGKTQFSRKMAEKEGYEYISFDDIFSKMFGAKIEPFLNYIITKTQNNDRDLVIDGWFAWEEDEVNSIDKLEKIETEWTQLYIPLWMSKERCRNKERSDDEIINLSWSRIIKGMDAIGKCRILDASDFSYPEMEKEDYDKMVSVLCEDDVDDFLDELKSQENYQNIKLPFDRETGGYKDCERSWSQIRPLIEWKDKTVMDIGCFWGYFAFEIKKEGAKEVMGTDIREDALDTARKIRHMKRVNVMFMKHDIEEDAIDKKYDVILLLNTLHHLRSPFHVLKKIFSSAKEVVLEVELAHNKYDEPIVEMGPPIKLSNGKMGGHLRFGKDMLMRFASENGHFLKKEVQSFRPDRTIMLFGRGE